MKRHILKFLSLALMGAALSIWSIACDTALIPTATPVLTPTPTAAAPLAPTPTAAPALAPILTGTPAATATPTAAPALAPTLTETPALAPTTTATPALAPTPTAVPALAPNLNGTPVANPTATATNFNPDLVVLAVIGSSETITVKTVGVDPGAQGVQIIIQHSAELQVSSPACAGIFTGGTELGPALVTGGTAIGCVLFAGQVSGPTGVAMTFELTRIGNFNTDQIVAFGLGEPLGTIYSDSGNTIDPGITNQLIVRPGSR